MRHAGTQEIKTPRLILRRLFPQDADGMYVNWANDPDVTRFLRWEPHKNAAETRQLLEAWATLYPNEDYYQWAIVEKATGQVFGSISIYNSLLGEPQQKAAWPGLDHLRQYFLDHINFANKFDSEMALTHNLFVNIDGSSTQ